MVTTVDSDVLFHDRHLTVDIHSQLLATIYVVHDNNMTVGCRLVCRFPTASLSDRVTRDSSS